MLLHLFIAALWSPAGKGLTSWLLFVMSNCDFVTFPCGILGQVWFLIVLILIFATLSMEINVSIFNCLSEKLFLYMYCFATASRYFFNFI